VGIRNKILDLATYPTFAECATRVLPPWVTVFMLHRMAAPGVSGIEPEHLRRCLRYLQENHYEFIDIDEAIKLAADNRLTRKRWVAFTVDDGFHDQVTTAADIFREFNCPATCFLVTGFVDGQLWPWDYQLMHIARLAGPQTIRIDIKGQQHILELGLPDTKHFLLEFMRKVAPGAAYESTQAIAHAAGIDLPVQPPADMQPASWDDVRKAELKGMRFGPHSVSHHILSKLDDEILQAEMVSSCQRLREECRNPSQLFCYPSGKANEFDIRTIKIARDLGLIGALSAEEGFLEAGKLQKYPNYRFAIPRLPIPNDFAEFKLYVSWLQHLRERVAQSPLQKFY